MKCKCSLNNNYEVIGLCDIEKFNEKIKQFMDKSWTQITIPEKLYIPSNKPSIKTVMKVYLNIKIISTKIIKTPFSNEPNIEGLSLTGKVLLVSGEICQNILYISETLKNSIHSFKFNNPFNTYIVIEENADLEHDNYCVYPCVEDVSVRILNERTLSKNVTLFLFAHKTTQTPLPPIIGRLPNAFILKTSDTDEEMTRIEFDTNTKKLVVTSTGKNYNQPRAINVDIFRFQMFQGSGLNVTDLMIKGMENADDFRDNLNDVPFNYGYTIRLRYRDRPKVILTNYPNIGNVYEMISERFQSFKITPTGIIPNLVQNSIILKNSNNQVVLITEFDKEALNLLVTSTGSISDNGSINYFKITIFEFDGITERFSANIGGNSNGAIFKNIANSQDFAFGNYIKLEYEDNTKVRITNFPNLNSQDYIPTGISEIFRFDSEDGLIRHSPFDLIKNEIILKNSNNQPVINIKLINRRFGRPIVRKLVINSTGNLTNSGGRNHFKFTLFAADGTTEKATSNIAGNNNGNNFKTTLNDQIFEINDIIKLEYEDNTQVLITNFPDLDTPNYTPNPNTQSLRITDDGLIRTN